MGGDFKSCQATVAVGLRVCLTATVLAFAAVATARADATPVAPLSVCDESPTGTLGDNRPVSVQFLGTASLSIADGATTIMTDGFFSRPGTLDVLFTRLAPNKARIDSALDQAQIKKIDAVFVAHSHFDHALDSAVVAAQMGAVLLGSKSTRNIALARVGNALPQIAESKVKVFDTGDVFTCGDFQVTIFSAPHSPNAFFPGHVETTFSLPAWVGKFKDGGSFGFLVEHPKVRILVVPSANERVQLPPGSTADVVFLSIGQLGKQDPEFAEKYWEKTVASTGAKKVVPIHWDDFTVELKAPLPALPRLFDNVEKAREFLKERAAKSKSPIEIIEMDAFQTKTFGD